MHPSDTVDIALLDHVMTQVFAEWVRLLELRLIEARPGEVVLALPVTARHVHAGNVMSGQTLMAAADSAIVAGPMPNGLPGTEAHAGRFSTVQEHAAPICNPTLTVPPAAGAVCGAGEMVAAQAAPAGASTYTRWLDGAETYTLPALSTARPCGESRPAMGAILPPAMRSTR